jgi:predicted phage terminase large subunit-like protein
MIPMDHDPSRHCKTVIGWSDPREHDGELAWPERFSPAVVKGLIRDLGPWAYASQYQQSPMPRGGGIFQRDWWQVWDPPPGPNGQQHFPVCEYMIASLDSAFTAKEENDPCALTLWGVFVHPQLKQRRIILMSAWEKHLAFSADRALIEWLPSERNAPLLTQTDQNGQSQLINHGYNLWVQRTQRHWGLLEWVRHSCRRLNVDKLLIEAKASGISAAQELQNRYGREGYAIQLCKVSGDKLARALAVQATFSQGMVYAPLKDWAELVINQAAVFPKGRRDDVVDSMTQAISHLRSVGLAQTDEEAQAEENERVTHRPRPRKALYPV